MAGRSLYFRFRKTPERHLPLTVRSVGHYRLPPTGLDDRISRKWFCQLFWTISGGGEFRLGKRSLRVGAGDLFYYLPGETHDLRSIGTAWSYRWITFDHPQSVIWLESLGLDRRPLPAGPCPEHLFAEVARALRRGTRAGDRLSAHHAHALLLAMQARDTATVAADSLSRKCRRQMDEHFDDPFLTIKRLSEEFSVHRSTLFRLFRKSFGITPSHYLHNLRIRRALVLLRQPNLQIQEVAWQSGFADPNYFSRAVRETTGLQPRAFRAAAQ